MPEQNFLNESDIDTLINLLLRSQQSRTREALCFSIGIDPKQISFLRDSSDSDFFLLLIKRLNEIGDQEALCKVCCKVLFPVFCKGKYGDILSDIAGKLNCSQEFRQNYPNNKQPTSPPSSPAPEFSVNFPKQLEVSKPQSLFSRIAHHRNKLFAVAAILMFGSVGYPVYKSFNLPSQYPSSFHNSCKNISISKNILTATCYSPTNQSRQTSIELKGIENINGELKVTDINKPSNFQDSCNNISIDKNELSASCTKPTGQSRQTSTVLNGIENINGILKYTNSP